jgi:hypothetical protein
VAISIELDDASKDKASSTVKSADARSTERASCAARGALEAMSCAISNAELSTFLVPLSGL